MTTKYMNIQRLFKLHNFKLGTKINLLVLSIIILTLVVGITIGLHLFKSYVSQINYQRLETLAEIKKAELEKQYNDFYQNFPSALTSEQISTVEQLKSAFTNYENNNFSLFSSDALKADSIALVQFYTDQIIANVKWETPELTDIFPTTYKTQVLQFFYTSNQEFTPDKKDELLMAKDNSEYSLYHQPFQLEMRKLAKQNNIQNIYLIDNVTGDVFYNLNKNIAFATNLFEGSLKQSKLAIVFQKALLLEPGHAVISDFSFFQPDLNKPVAFLAFPIFNGNNKSAVFVAELAPEFFEKIIYGNDITQFNTSISFNLIGNDNLLRTNDINQLINSKEFFKDMADKGRRKKTFKQVAVVGSSAMILGYDKKTDLNSGIDTKAEGYLTKTVYLSSIPLELKGLDWTIVACMNGYEANHYVRKWGIILFGALLIVVIIALVSTNLINKSVARRLKSLAISMTGLSNGEKSEDIEIKWHDEIGETIEVFDKLKNRINSAGEFALDLSEGKYGTEFKALSENDEFAKSLNTLKERLKSNKDEAEIREKEDKIRNWTNEGIARFNDLLRQSNNNINNLAYIVIENLIGYLEANQGGVFLVEGGTETKTINLIASYAYNKRKYLTKSIEIGEGLLGNCYLERKPIHLRDLPEEYIEITSGLGKATPRSLYISPMILDNEVLGFIEIASFGIFSDFQIDFINKLTENIAATFATVRLNTRTSELLEESKRRTNEIAQQEEEMRQNMEEMQATQEELSRLRSQDEEKTLALKQEIESINKFLQALLNSYDGEVYLKDSSGIIVLANEEAANRFKLTTEKIKGKTVHDLFEETDAKSDTDIDNQIITDKFYSGEKIELVNGREIKYFIIKKQFYIPTTKELGILTIRMKKAM